MTQNIVDFSDNPTGEQLMDDYLAKFQENVNTGNSGILRPSYAVAGMRWIDTSAKPWMLKVYDGKNDIIEGYVDTDNGLYIPIKDYTNITNCLTEIPQDIKLELADGTLTLKAGSKVYVPNGVGVFDEVVISRDITIQGFSNFKGAVVINADGGGYSFTSFDQCYSGTLQPVLSNGVLWYDTSSNIVKRCNDGQTFVGPYSLPICIIISSGSSQQVSTVANIDQVFNGFGYIGNTLFALPGIKGLIPNGFNTDGSLNSVEFTTTSVLTKALIGKVTNKPVVLKSNDIGTADIIYNQNTNTNSINYCNCGIVSTDSTGRITSLTPNTAFHAVDYSEYAREVGRCAKVDEDNEFTKNITFLSSVQIKSNTIDINNVTQADSSNIFIKDKNGVITGVIQRYYASTGSGSIAMIIRDKAGEKTSISLNRTLSGDAYVTIPQPKITDNGQQAVTANWVNNKFKVVSTLPAEPDANVFYLIPEE